MHSATSASNWAGASGMTPGMDRGLPVRPGPAKHARGAARPSRQQRHAPLAGGPDLPAAISRRPPPPAPHLAKPHSCGTRPMCLPGLSPHWSGRRGTGPRHERAGTGNYACRHRHARRRHIAAPEYRRSARRPPGFRVTLRNRRWSAPARNSRRSVWEFRFRAEPWVARWTGCSARCLRSRR